MANIDEARFIKLIADAVNALRPYIKQLVDEAVREIPYTVKKEFIQLTQCELSSILREEIRQRVHVSFEIREKYEV